MRVSSDRHCGFAWYSLRLQPLDAWVAEFAFLSWTGNAVAFDHMHQFRDFE